MKGLSWELPVHDVDENAGDSILFKMTRMGVGETGLLTIHVGTTPLRPNVDLQTTQPRNNRVGS